MDDVSRTAFEGLYLSHVGQIEAYVRRRTTPEAAEEVVSETFLTAWRRLDEARDGGRPWLFRTASNVLKNRVRSDARQLRVAAKQASLPASPSPDHANAVTERAWVVSVLRELSERDQEVLMLAHWEELTNREIAEVLGCSRPVASLRLHRAHGRFERVLERRAPPDRSILDSRKVTR